MDEIKKQLNYNPQINYKEDYYSEQNVISANKYESVSSSNNLVNLINLIDSTINGLPNDLSKAISEVYDPVKDLYFNYLYDKNVEEVPPYEDSNINTDNEDLLEDDVNIFLNKNILKLKVKQIEELVYTTVPTKISKNNIIWMSSNEDIATVKNGVVTAVSKGVCLITVCIKGTDKKATCRVTVVDGDEGEGEEEEIVDPILPTIRDIYLDKRLIVIMINEDRTLTYRIVPSNAEIEGVEWDTSDHNIATVVDGVVTGVSKGSCEVSVKIINSNKMARCKVIVLNVIDEGGDGGEEEGGGGDIIDVSVNRVEISKRYIELKEQQLYRLFATVYPTNAKNKEVKWISTDEEVATVDNGLVTAVAVGQCRVIVSTVEGNKKATCYVTVSEDTDDPKYPDIKPDPGEDYEDDEDGLWENTDIPTIEIEVNDPRDIIPIEFIKNINDLINYYLNGLSDTLSSYYFQTLILTTDIENDKTKFVLNDLVDGKNKVKTQYQHLFDIGLRSQRVSNIKLNYLENCFNINQSVLHIQSLLAIYEMRNKYANIKYQTGYSKDSSEANMMLKGSNKDYDLKYEKTYKNLFKYLDSSLKITGDVMNNVVQGYKAKQLLVKKGGIK